MEKFKNFVWKKKFLFVVLIYILKSIFYRGNQVRFVEVIDINWQDKIKHSSKIWSISFIERNSEFDDIAITLFSMA